MVIQTKFHGEQEIISEQILRFPSGIPGFLEEKEFVLFPIEDTPLLTLQSIHTKEIAFIMTEPFSFFPQYEFELPQDIIENLNIKSKKDISIFVFLTIKEPFNQTTANLQAPIVINHSNLLGKQLILNIKDYHTKHLIINPLEIQGEGK